MVLLKKLKSDTNSLQAIQLSGALDTNFQHLVKSDSCISPLATAYQHLTPTERLVAAMIRQGFSTQTIAKTLSITSGTVNIHRKHIRKKLGLHGKSINLYRYLLSITE